MGFKHGNQSEEDFKREVATVKDSISFFPMGYNMPPEVKAACIKNGITEKKRTFHQRVDSLNVKYKLIMAGKV